MKNQNLSAGIDNVSMIAEELHNLLHEDAFHRLRLYQDYSRDDDNNKWTPDLYLRCQLVETLCRNLDKLKELELAYLRQHEKQLPTPDYNIKV